MVESLLPRWRISVSAFFRFVAFLPDVNGAQCGKMAVFTINLHFFLDTTLISYISCYHGVISILM